jgi:hypothetical protein
LSSQFDRETLEAVNGGHAIKRVYTANKVAFNQAFAATLTADQVFGIVTDYSMLHNNVQPSMTERYHPDCSATSDSRSCGLNGHCGSKLSIAHEFSYETSPGVPAYGATSGVGFEDDVMFIAEEGHPLAGWGDGDAITGTVQVLDVRKGELYQLPHLSVGVIEMAFTVSTGHPDYIAVGIEEYGISGEKNGVQGGSRWNLWIGKKNKASDNFLERNGLAPNSGRIYVFVADSGEEDSKQRPCTHTREPPPHHHPHPPHTRAHIAHAGIPQFCFVTSHKAVCPLRLHSGYFPRVA